MKLLIIYTDAGGGHRRTAEALKAYLNLRHPAWAVKLVNLYREVLYDVDPCPKLTPYHCEDVYNRFVLQNHRGSFLTWPILALVYLFLRFCRAGAIFRRISKLWQRETPDLVVSVMPLLNRVINESLKAYNPAIPSVTVITDFAEYLYKSWFATSGETVVCGTRKSRYQAKCFAYPTKRVLQTNGLIIDHRFLEKPKSVRQRELIARHGLNPAVPVGLVIYGGYGNPQLCHIAKQLARCRRELQFIFVCGHNAALYTQMQQLRLPYKAVILPFVENVADYLHLASFVITKPGPGSLAECVSAHKPVITELNFKTLLHERYNAKWLRDHGFGFVMRRYQQLPRLVDRLLAPPVYQKIFQRLSQYQNTALVDTTALIEQLLQPAAVTRQNPLPGPEQLELTV